MTEDLRITADDIRKAGHCIVPGARDWFARHGLDFRKFIKEGIPASEFLAAGDALAKSVVDKKKQREGIE